MPVDFTWSQWFSVPHASPVWKRRLAYIVWAMIAAVGVILAVRIVLASQYSGADSWFAMSRAIEFMDHSPPAQVYDDLLFSRHIKFQYPPSGVLPLKLFNWLGIEGIPAYNAVNAWLLLATGVVFAYFVSRLIGPTYFLGFRVPLEPIAFLISIKFYPDRSAYELGQIQVLLGLFFIVACVALLYARRALAGVMIAVITTVKPQFVLFGAWAAWRRDWRFVVAFCMVGVLALTLAVGLYGWDAQVSYLKVLQFLSRHGECYHTNQSVNGILSRYLGEMPCIDADPHADPTSPVLSSWFPPYNAVVHYATVISSLALIALPFLFRAKGGDSVSQLLNFTLASVVFTMASPIAWVHHYNVLLPAYVVAFKAAVMTWRGMPGIVAVVILAISLLLTGWPIADPFAPTRPELNLFQSHVFIGTCLLLVVMLAEMRVYGRVAEGS